MPNKTSALEWLIIAYHDLKSAKILFDANPSYSLPKKEEIETILDFTEELPLRVCKIVGVNEDDLKDETKYK